MEHNTGDSPYGTWEERLPNTPVHSQGWWFFVVRGLKLAGVATLEEPVCHGLPLEALLDDSRPNPAWVLEQAPTALPCPEAVAPLQIDLLAVRANRPEPDEVYPFRCAEHNGVASLWFSSVGPAPELRREISRALWARLTHGVARDARGLPGRISWPEVARLCKSSEPSDLTVLRFEWGPTDHVLRRFFGTSALPRLREVHAAIHSLDDGPLRLFRGLEERGRPLHRMTVSTWVDLALSKKIVFTLRLEAGRLLVEAERSFVGHDDVEVRLIAKGLGLAELLSDIVRAS
jgi:hypothetical protein